MNWNRLPFMQIRYYFQACAISVKNLIVLYAIQPTGNHGHQLLMKSPIELKYNSFVARHKLCEVEIWSQILICNVKARYLTDDFFLRRVMIAKRERPPRRPAPITKPFIDAAMQRSTALQLFLPSSWPEVEHTSSSAGPPTVSKFLILSIPLVSLARAPELLDCIMLPFTITDPGIRNLGRRTSPFTILLASKETIPVFSCLSACSILLISPSCECECSSIAQKGFADQRLRSDSIMKILCKNIELDEFTY